MISTREPAICNAHSPTHGHQDAAMTFGEQMEDSRLTEPSCGKLFRLREAILLSKRLGRSLTDEEMQPFVLE